jgi:glycosyltransferase involved in cell wall biosynthesis
MSIFNSMKANASRVSVIIPAYNQARFLAGAIQSVTAQTYRSYEIIVIDDGSTDHCHEVAASFGEQVRYIAQQNQGLAGARNTGIQAASGEFVGLLDADDLWLPNFLERMVSLADQKPAAAVYYCCAQGMDELGNNLPQVFGGPPINPSLMYQTLLRSDFLIPSTILLRRDTIVAAGLFDPSLRSCEDWELWLRILPKHDFIGTADCLVQYRLHGSSLSKNVSVMQHAVRSVMEKHFGPDDGQPGSWSQEKRRAYGGVYRYHALTSVQRLEDWQAGAEFFKKALQADPSLSTDLDFFYDLAHGTQPAGYRNTNYRLDFDANAERMIQLLNRVFDSSKESELELGRRRSFGTAYYALGLLAYNTGRLSLSRDYFRKALVFRPDLWMDKRVIGNSLKTILGPSTVEWMKKYRRHPQ